MRFGVVPLFWTFLWNVSFARAEVGIVVYESKGVDSRRTNSGHIALIATNLCAAGIDQVRSCNSGEEPGIVATRYLNLAYGYNRSVFVAPIRAHFNATRDPALIPALTNDDTLEAMQIGYWRQYLRPYLPPLSRERYAELLHQSGSGRTVRGLISLETALGALDPQQKYATATVALTDPVTGELIPNGNWREAIGAAHVRSSVRITIPATPVQETHLIAFIAAVNKQPFQAIADNCSDFVERGLLAVFAGSGLHFRPRIARFADAWITNPLAIATDFLAYAKRQRAPITVLLVPKIAGARAPTAPIRSLTRGALVPNPSQGKVLFGIKLAINTVNPLLGVAAYTVDKLSRFADLEQLAHERGGGELSRIADEIQTKANVSGKDLDAWHREQVKLFGTADCWKAKEDALRTLAAAARESELVSSSELALLLKRDRPFLLPRWYAHAANRNLNVPFGAGRPQIGAMADSSRESRLQAFRLMLSVVNYDLSSDAVHRRTAPEFDEDWTLFVKVAQQNGLHVPAGSLVREVVADCSCRQFDAQGGTRDALARRLGFSQELASQGRQMVFGRTR